MPNHSGLIIVSFSIGMPNSSGLVTRKDYRCENDCPVVERLREAGAIPYCITNVSELCMWYESANRLYGRSCNPYNTSRIVGGSSGIFFLLCMICS